MGHDIMALTSQITEPEITLVNNVSNDFILQDKQRWWDIRWHAWLCKGQNQPSLWVRSFAHPILHTPLPKLTDDTLLTLVNIQ